MVPRVSFSSIQGHLLSTFTPWIDNAIPGPDNKKWNATFSFFLFLPSDFDYNQTYWLDLFYETSCDNQIRHLENTCPKETTCVSIRLAAEFLCEEKNSAWKKNLIYFRKILEEVKRNVICPVPTWVIVWYVTSLEDFHIAIFCGW